MKIKRLVIENFKSIERIELIEPNPFTVFVGPNGSGKSNIFEALEFVNSCSKSVPQEAIRQFGGVVDIANRKLSISKPFHFLINYDIFPEEASLEINFDQSLGWFSKSRSLPSRGDYERGSFLTTPNALQQFSLGFSRFFVKNKDLLRIDYQDNVSLNLAATNLEKVLKRILYDNSLQSEIFEWLGLFVPGFKAVEIDDRNELHWFEEFAPSYFTKDLISDGTYNILALLTAVYQSDEPQFLCIEEPENGLHPQVLTSLVDFFRQQCKEKGHYIWLNTHSESIVRCLTTDEIVLVNKRNGSTQTRQIKGRNIYDLPTDQAWLTGALGGGLPW
ncbi:AAA family ATPase [Spirosoma sp. HMF3257]|uniref:Chromosome segregation protein SMC n=1 Tax=Spirosoma telluris TaxID=2183553 RepID=A0A327NJH8_9BACT|nr:AAA family ATPase [Spirosoma telluris]RAI74186.1 chromosome segregation protein SMC [Spirosoma telluris]